jgi:dihydroorotase
MEFARSYDLPIIQHCEDLNLSAGGDMHEGVQSVRWGLRGIPAASEDVMVARDLVLAQLTGARYHVAHISTRNAVAMVEYARRQGLPVTCETTPHHFAMTDAEMAPYDSNYKMKPPLRSCGHRDAIVDGLAAGTIGAIATDHAPHPGSEKMQEFERCPFGIIGLETAIALALEELVAPGKITLSRLVDLFTMGPESVMRLGRGTLAPGAPGDVTVFSTDVEWTYDVNQSPSRSRNSPFHGRTFHGGPMATVVDGEMKWRR